ncbi:MULTISPECIES: restriction endonuclease subunit S [unclassified Undibacterium]|uniref:restriction endonuclease subunit S n=1 Tax=unclassified Undibacterium TaxID=2630295 RepID=UPI002AC94AC3|nr:MULTISPECIES: restriction endonuclease subunit S [unclassified Undibacterium]MEB0140352.1 restriction endonuclease subunit S [Undibacterium sp. CCC2.1]MEB0173403.1 restriction endonuclease subunit S [Undibacterium sp. CCC1.1]MEB0176800.1 restriction endonuclease subunit S [Undibacterium sp. CCC3.4]MEB0216543.1 restriction endonuclease subunit S [Undibacterium sp. 5I2]WPX43380.1 restriction endonuclease subunit S [Undibacterium sp. CCC3.4]
MSQYKPYASYKNSGIEWIGNVPEHWDVTRIKRASSLRTERCTDASDGSNYIGLEDVESGTGKYRPTEGSSRQNEDSTVGVFRSGDVLYGKLRPYLKKAIVTDSNGLCSTEFLVIQPRSVISAWLHQWMLTTVVTQQIEAGCEGSKMPRADWEHVCSLHVPSPKPSEQSEIIDVLDRETKRIDSLIAKKSRFIELLKEKRQALITNAVTKGLDPNVKMKDSGVELIGDIPVHWSIKRLKHLLQSPLKYGANESGDDSILEGPRYIRITDLDESGSLRNNSVKRLPFDIAQPYMLADGDILFARSGATVGKTYRYKSEHGPACFAGYLIRGRFDANQVIPDFIALAVRSYYYWDYIQRTAIQATIENVGAERYGEFPVSLPDVQEQMKIVETVDAAMNRIDLLIRKTQHSVNLLKERRSAFITAAVTGQIDLREFA